MASGTPTDDLTGIVGFAADLIDSLGEWGVGLFTLLETVFPPIPSEVILPLAGFISSQGSINLVLAVVTSTLGAYLGGALLYLLGAKVGLERGIRLLARLPLVDRDDFEKAAAWFDRHGKSAVFFGRLVPGVRSVVSLPAGAGGMNFGLFSALTLGGSAIWNGLLIGLGALLGEQYELVSQYSNWLNYAVYLGFGIVIVFLVVRHIKRRRAAST
ncbi:MAG: DedA family protein [Mycetocola sp.]